MEAKRKVKRIAPNRNEVKGKEREQREKKGKEKCNEGRRKE